MYSIYFDLVPFLFSPTATPEKSPREYQHISLWFSYIIMINNYFNSLSSMSTLAINCKWYLTSLTDILKLALIEF